MSLISNGTVSKKMNHRLQIKKMYFPFCIGFVVQNMLSMKSVGESSKGSYSLNILPGEEFLIYMSLENSCQSNSLLGTVHSFSPCFQINKCLAEVKRKKRLVTASYASFFPAERTLQVCRPQRIQPTSLENMLLMVSNTALARTFSSF